MFVCFLFQIILLWLDLFSHYKVYNWNKCQQMWLMDTEARSLKLCVIITVLGVNR